MTDAPDWIAAAQVADAPTSRRSPTVFLVLGIIAILGLIGNIVGGLNFPPNAPVEQIECFGFVVDGLALVILAVIGLLVARQLLPVRSSSRLAPIGMALAGIALALCVIFAVVPSVIDLSQGYSLHYSTEIDPAFLLAAVWITGIAFCSFAYRVGGTASNNLFALLGLGFGVAVYVLATASSVIYGLGLST